MIISKKQEGFTLIELITVIAIIMILMDCYSAFNQAKEAARRPLQRTTSPTSSWRECLLHGVWKISFAG